MKMRKRKQVVWSRMAPKIWDAYWQRLIDAALEDTPEEKEARRLRDEERWNTIWADISRRQSLRVLVEPEPGDYAEVG